jgi:hypothetical protein
MDYEYWLRLGKCGARFAYLEEKLSGSRLYTENKTLGARVNVHKEINDMFKKRFGQVPDRWLFNYAHAVVDTKVNREKTPKRYVIEVALRTTLSAVRWNRSVSGTMCETLRRWF